MCLWHYTDIDLEEPPPVKKPRPRPCPRPASRPTRPSTSRERYYERTAVVRPPERTRVRQNVSVSSRFNPNSPNIPLLSWIKKSFP